MFRDCPTDGVSMLSGDEGMRSIGHLVGCVHLPSIKTHTRSMCTVKGPLPQRHTQPLSNCTNPDREEKRKPVELCPQEQRGCPSVRPCNVLAQKGCSEEPRREYGLFVATFARNKTAQTQNENEKENKQSERPCERPNTSDMGRRAVCRSGFRTGADPCGAASSVRQRRVLTRR